VVPGEPPLFGGMLPESLPAQAVRATMVVNGRSELSNIFAMTILNIEPKAELLEIAEKYVDSRR
jgi:hypothetical protein